MQVQYHPLYFNDLLKNLVTTFKKNVEFFFQFFIFAIAMK